MFAWIMDRNECQRRVGWPARAAVTAMAGAFVAMILGFAVRPLVIVSTLVTVALRNVMLIRFLRIVVD